MIPPWLQTKKPESERETAAGRDPDRVERAIDRELFVLGGTAAFVLLVAAAFFSLLFQSVWPVVVGLAVAAVLFLIIRAVWRRLRRRG